MSTTYFQRDTAASNTGTPPTPVLTSRLASQTAGGASANIATGNIGGGLSTNIYFFTGADDPSTDGSTGDYSVVLRFSVTNAQIQVSVALARVNSTGVEQATTALSAEQQSNNSPLTFDFTAEDLGTWASGDRLRVRVQLRNQHGMNQSCTLAVNTADDTIDTPFGGETLEPVGRSAGLGWDLHGVVGRSAGVGWDVETSGGGGGGSGVEATGGNDIFDDDTHRYHVFTADGTLTVTEGGSVEYLVVGGGGAGGRSGSGGGGGGAGRVLLSGDTLAVDEFPVVVGDGGAAPPGTQTGDNGDPSSFNGESAAGGGGGGGGNGVDGADGGNGGGGCRAGVGGASTGGGFAGGTGSDHASNDFHTGGGGGGASEVGKDGVGDGTSALGGDGGDGLNVWGLFPVGGGGGGSVRTRNAPIFGRGEGGFGGGGQGAQGTGSGNQPSAGEPNTGGGGGGGLDSNVDTGGSGLVVIRYELEPSHAAPVGRSATLGWDVESAAPPAPGESFAYSVHSDHQRFTEKPRKPIFWHDGHWWSFSGNDQDDITVNRRDASGDWQVASPTVSSQRDRRSDVHLVGDDLYWYSHHTTPQAGKLTYNSGSKTWSIDVAATNVAASNHVADVSVDGQGRVWCFRRATGEVRGFVLDGDDLSVLQAEMLITDEPDSSEHMQRSIAWDGKVGIIFDDQATPLMRFAWRDDTDALDDPWTIETVASGASIADDHGDVTPGPGSDLLACWKTSNTGSGDDIIMYSRRTGTSWSTPEVVWVRFGSAGNNEHTRPRIVYDATNEVVYVVATRSAGGGPIQYRSRLLDTPGWSAEQTIIGFGGVSGNDVTVPRHPVTSASGLLVLARTGTDVWEGSLAIEGPTTVGRSAGIGWDLHGVVGRSAETTWDVQVLGLEPVGRSATLGWDVESLGPPPVGRSATLGWDLEAVPPPSTFVQTINPDGDRFRVDCSCHWRSRRWPTADLAVERERHHSDMHDWGAEMPRAHVVWDGRGFPPPAGGNGEPSEPRSSLTQHGLTVTFDDEYPTGQFVSGDWWVVGSPTVVSTSPAWDGSRHGTTINPGLHTSGYHINMGYDAAKNIGHQLPFQLEPGDTIIHTHGWLASDPEVQALGITITVTPNAPRPCIRDSMIVTVLAEAPPAGSFRPPYVAGPKWMFNTSQLDWDVLGNVTPLGNAPSWEVIQASISRPWAPDAGYGPTTSRYLHPYFHMPDYGRDMCAQMYRAILRLNTDATQQQKEFTLHRVVQYGIDALAITRLADEETFRISGAATSLGSWWADFGGGHGVGRDLPALLAKKMLGDPSELQAAWDVGPRYWGDMGQIWVSDGSAADPFRSVGDATWGERAHTRSHTNPGSTGYRICCTTRSVMGGMTAAHIMGITAEWDHEDAPLPEYVDWYVDVDQVNNSTNRAAEAWFADMWDTYR